MPPFGSVGFSDSYASMKGARTKASIAPYTVADLARDYQKSDGFLNLAPKSQRIYAYTIRRIVDLMGEYFVDDVSRRDVQGFLDNDIEGAGAHNMFLAVLEVLYKWGRAREKTDLKPTEGIEKRRTPFLNELREELAHAPRKGLTIVTGQRGRTYQTVRLELQAFTRSMGVNTVPHGLRKNAVSAFLAAGCTVAEAASITGQSYQIVEYYAKRINQRGMAKAAVLKLETKRRDQKAIKK